MGCAAGGDPHGSLMRDLGRQGQKRAAQGPRGGASRVRPPRAPFDMMGVTSPVEEFLGYAGNLAAMAGLPDTLLDPTTISKRNQLGSLMRGSSAGRGGRSQGPLGKQRLERPLLPPWRDVNTLSDSVSDCGRECDCPEVLSSEPFGCGSFRTTAVMRQSGRGRGHGGRGVGGCAPARGRRGIANKRRSRRWPEGSAGAERPPRRRATSGPR